jgi:hypothetical protein
MSRKSLQELVQLYFYDELSPSDKQRVEDMLASSAEWRAELDELKKLHRLMIQHMTPDVSDQLLQEARSELRAAIRIERARQPWTQRFAEFFGESVFVEYRLVFGGVATLALGFLLGYAIFATPGSDHGPSLFSQASSSSVIDQGEPLLTNVRFVERGSKDGTVELTFDAVTPIRVKGNINDDRITKVLARAMLNEQNPGVRLRSVSTFSDQSRIQRSTEKEVKSSLIAVIKYDENRGVRKEALKALQKFPVDDDIVEAILFVLKNEKHTGMRIAAINFLDFAKLMGSPVDKDLLEMLKEKMQSDDNNYIRIRGSAAFQEARQ